MTMTVKALIADLRTLQSRMGADVEVVLEDFTDPSRIENVGTVEGIVPASKKDKPYIKVSL